jgi:hypothetical protein
MRAKNAKEADEIAARITAQNWLDAGYTHAALDQSAQVADLLDRLVAPGRPLDAVLAEWEGKTAAEILQAADVAPRAAAQVA